jgi:hypothetical protein
MIVGVCKDIWGLETWDSKVVFTGRGRFEETVDEEKVQSQVTNGLMPCLGLEQQNECKMGIVGGGRGW